MSNFVLGLLVACALKTGLVVCLCLLTETILDIISIGYSERHLSLS